MKFTMFLGLPQKSAGARELLSGQREREGNCPEIVRLPLSLSIRVYAKKPNFYQSGHIYDFPSASRKAHDKRWS